MAAFDALCTSGNCTTATLVGRTGARRMVTAQQVVFSTSSRETFQRITFSHYAKCALSTNEEMCSVEPSRALPCSSTCLNDFTGRQHNSLVLHVSKVHDMIVSSAKFPLTAFKNHSARAVPYRTAFAECKLMSGSLEEYIN